MTRHVIGIDPSLTATAIASSAGWVEVVGEPGKRTDGYRERFNRINSVYGEARNWLSSNTELVVIEGPSLRSADPSVWDRAYLWWLFYEFCSHHQFPVAVVTPSQRMLYATGRGLASKGAVIDAVARRWPQYVTEGDDNAADAVVLMAMGLDWSGRPLTPMPATHRRALDKVAWPDKDPS